MTPRPPTAAAQRRARLRSELFGDVKEELIWDRKKFVGFTTIPRTLPLILTIIDSLDRRSAGRVYFDLWCRAFDESFVEIRDEYESAFFSGYFGQRAVRTWRERVDVLAQHSFIRVKKGAHGGYRYVLLLDPHLATQTLADQGRVSDEYMIALKAQLISIGAIRE